MGKVRINDWKSKKWKEVIKECCIIWWNSRCRGRKWFREKIGLGGRRHNAIFSNSRSYLRVPNFHRKSGKRRLTQFKWAGRRWELQPWKTFLLLTHPAKSIWNLIGSYEQLFYWTRIGSDTDHALSKRPMLTRRTNWTQITPSEFRWNLVQSSK